MPGSCSPPLGVLLSVVDHRARRLPDVLTLPFAATALTALGVSALLPDPAGSWPHAMVGTLVLGGCYLALFVFTPSGIGFGDVKLALGLGAVLGWYGWDILFLGSFAGLFLASFFGVTLLVRGMGRQATIAFGPFLLTGAWLGAVTGALVA